MLGPWLLASPAFGQVAGAPPRLDTTWRRVGTTTRLLALPAPAGGALERVWFDARGNVTVRVNNGGTWVSVEGEGWAESASGPVPPRADAIVLNLSERPQAVRVLETGGRLYAWGEHLWRSVDGGRTWRNQTATRDGSLLGGPLADVSVSAGDPDRIVAANGYGLWVSADGGFSWTGLNEGLPAFQPRRILAAPEGPEGLRIALEEPGGALAEAEWAPGQKQGWTAVDGGLLRAEEQLREALALRLTTNLSAAASRDQFLLAGGADRRIYASLDGGENWRVFDSPGGEVRRFWISPDGRAALALLAAPNGQGPRVLRSLNSGAWWDDLTSNLPAGEVVGVAAEAGSGAIYLATPRAVYLTMGNLQAPAPATGWTRLATNLPSGQIYDIYLDRQGLQLYTAIGGHGIFAAAAPHRTAVPALVHAADSNLRSAAPGALLSVIGARVNGGVANDRDLTVLAAAETESQLQVPFEVEGESLRLTVNSGNREYQFGLALRPAAPAILVDREGTPLILDSESGLQLDAAHALRPGMRIQVLATGLGKVLPEWPAGLAAPLADPPRVVLPVQARLSGLSVPVQRATLAPGYIGYYLVELELPQFLNAGPAELEIQAGGNVSNRVRVYVDPY